MQNRNAKSAGKQFRLLIARRSIAIPGAFNAATARLIERAGFPAVYISGAGLANAAAGVPDIGLLSLNEVIQLAGYIAQAVKIPAICDADTGFDDPAKTAAEFSRAGMAGLHIEDQVFPKRCGHLGGKEIVPAAEMARRIRSAARGRRSDDFLIIARTDARSVEGLDAAVERARIYLEAGADAIFPEALESKAEFARFAKSVNAVRMANMTEFGRSPLLSARELAKLGYRIVIFPQTAFRLAMKAEEMGLDTLKKSGSQKQLLQRMQTRDQLYNLLEYDPNADTWPAT